jgi:hypothetical protein
MMHPSRPESWELYNCRVIAITSAASSQKAQALRKEEVAGLRIKVIRSFRKSLKKINGSAVRKDNNNARTERAKNWE